MTGPSLWVVAPSLVQGVCTYHITLAPRTQLGKATLLLSGTACGRSAHLPHALESVQIPMSAGPLEHRFGGLELKRNWRFLAQQGEGFLQLAARLGRVQGDGAPGLGELCATGLGDQRQVRIAGSRQLQRTLQGQLPGRAV